MLNSSETRARNRSVCFITFDNMRLPSALGIGYIVSYYRRHGKWKDIRFVHKRLDPSGLSEHDKQTLAGLGEHDILAFSCMTMSMNKFLRVADLVQEAAPGALKILGGAHSTTHRRVVHDMIDLYGVGEGEEAFRILLDRFYGSGTIGEEDIDSIPNMVTAERFRQGIGDYGIEMIKDLDSIPNIDRNWLKGAFSTAEEGGRNFQRCTALMTSRGCPFSCTFCAAHVIWQHRVRYHGTGYVADEVESLVKEQGCDLIRVMDDHLPSRKKRLAELIDELAARDMLGKVNFTCSARAENFDEETARLLSALGVVRVAFGFEFGTESLIQVNKGGKASLEDNMRALNLCVSHGMTPQIHLLVGFPEQGEDDVRNCFNYFEGLERFHFQLNVLLPIPGTMYFDTAVEKGVFPEDAPPWEAYQPVTIYPSSKYTPEELEGMIRRTPYVGEALSPRDLACVIHEELQRFQV